MARASTRGSIRPHAFSYRDGVRISGTHLTCDAAGSISDLVFLSHAQAVRARRQGGRRGGRHEVLATEATLAMLGPAGEDMRARALPAGYGRPFVLGGLRLELVRSGYLPGAASLLCEADGRQILYAGTIRGDAEVRRADALCLDATFGSPRFAFPPRAEALAAIARFVADARAETRTPVLLVPPFGPAMEVAAALGAQGTAVRAHRAIDAAAGRFRAAGVPTPAMSRFSDRVAADEALLWPPDARDAPALAALRARFAFVSGFSVDAEALAHVRADVGIALSNQADFGDLMAYVDATGAREVALHRGFADEMAATLRGRGYDAYTVGPPRQMDLFQG